MEESTDDDGLDSEESEVEKTIRKTIKDTIVHSSKEGKAKKCKKNYNQNKSAKSRRQTYLEQKQSTVFSVKRHKARFIDILK